MSSEIDKKIRKIERSFDVSELLDEKVSKEDIQEYYKQNSLLYKLLLSPKGYIHMGLSEDGDFSRDDLNEIPRRISEIIQNSDVERVLELGMGKGANLEYLARKNPGVSFEGLDLSDKNVKIAEKKLSGFDNCSILQKDYHDLSNYDENQFDLVFASETLCYSDRIEEVFAEVKRILQPEGVFIVFDGYLTQPRESLSKNELKAQTLLERSFAMKGFKEYEEFKERARTEGFVVQSEEDLSEQIIPTLERFPRLTGFFYNHPLLNYPVRKLLPRKILYKSISAYVIADLVENNIDCYYQTQFKLSQH